MRQMAKVSLIIVLYLALLNSYFNSGLYGTIASKSQVLKSELDDMLNDDYDTRQRPQSDGGPTLIEMGIEIEEIGEVSDVDMDYSLTFDLHQSWFDQRLAFKHRDLINLSVTLDNRVIDQIWISDVYLSNDKKSYMHQITKDNTMLRIEPGGKVLFGMRITADLQCHIKLERFPLDIQHCWINLESYGYTTKDVCLLLKKEALSGQENIKLAQFQLVDIEMALKNKTISTGVYAGTALKFTLKRNLGFFVLQTYVPSTILTVISWISFWINHECTSARVALGITAVLAITTISNSSRKSLPKISDMKALDVYLVACFAFVFFGLMEYIILNYLHHFIKIKKEREKECNLSIAAKKMNEKRTSRSKPRKRSRFAKFFQDHLSVANLVDWLQLHQIDDVTKIDQGARILFPCLFALFNCFYWTYYNFF